MLSTHIASSIFGGSMFPAESRERETKKKSALHKATISRCMQTKMKENDQDDSIERKRVYHFMRISIAAWETLVGIIMHL